MISKMRILLTTSAAPLQSPFSTTEKRPPLGMGFLISVLRNAGHEVFFIDNYLQPSNFLETDYLKRNEIDFVGIYANTICYRDTLRMLYGLQYQRQTGKWKGKIVVGGPHACVGLDTIPEFVDYVVLGEGEKAILDIVEGKAKERVIRYSPLKNLDDLPMPAWDYFINLPYKWSVDWFPDSPVFTMNTSRGCPFNCSFCSVGSIWGNKYTYFSAERIVSEIEYLATHYGAKGIYFREDNFTLNKSRLRRFCDLIIEKNIKMPWYCESRVDSIDRETVELMYRAGVRAFYFGVESGSQKILDFLQKGTSIEQILNSFKLCHEFGIKTAASIIVGVPTETEDDIKATNQLINEIRPTVTWYNVFVGIPDSKLYQYVLERKLHEFIDDRGLVYLKGHNERVERFYGKQWDANLPYDANNPKISVIMSVYNGEKYVKKAIESILKQTFQNFEFIIINDASTDNTANVLNSFSDPRIRLISNIENIGLTASLIRGALAARGQFIARMDSDDLSLPHRFEVQLKFLEENPECALVGSSYYHINEFGEIFNLIKVLTDHKSIKANLIQQNWFGHGTVLIRKNVYDAVHGYNPEFKYAQDYDLWLRISDYYGVANIEEPLYCWRSTTACISIEKAAEQKQYAKMAQELAKNRIFLKSEHGSDPLVTVIVPTYNRPSSLVETIHSILDQTYQNIEIIVINDAGENVENIVSALNIKGNITYINNSHNMGLAAARNNGIKVARGKYIAYLDDDDLFYPDHVETLVRFLESGEYKVAYTDAYRAHQEKKNGKYIVTKRDVPYSFDFDYNKILTTNFVPVLCFMHECSCVEKAGLFDESLKNHEDWDMWIRMSRKFKFAHIKALTCEFSWRTDGTTMTSGNIRGHEEGFRLIRERYAGTQRSNIPQRSGQRPVSASIIIPVFNKVEYTRKCLKALIESTPEDLYQIIIVDNASTDGTKAFLQTFAKNNLKVICNENNLGFAKACNQGAKVASCEYLLFLNNDTEPQQGWLEPLINVLSRDDSVVAAGSKLLFPDGTIQHAGVAIIEDRVLPDLLVARHLYYQKPVNLNEANRLMTYQALTAACVLVRKSAFDKVGGFDEKYWNGYEDVDLCFKLQEQGGNLVYQPESVVIHYESQSGPERFTETRNNIDRLHKKWLGKIKPDIIIGKNGDAMVTNAGKIHPYYAPGLPQNQLTSRAASTASNPNLVSIVILTFNQLKHTKLCLKSIEKCTPQPHELILVDNGSTDGTLDYLHKYANDHDNVRVIANKENLGFAAGNNQGLAVAQGNYVLMLNNDTVVAKGWLGRMLSVFERYPEVGIVGPVSNNVSGPQQVKEASYQSLKDMPSFAKKWSAGHVGESIEYQRVVGFCLLAKRAVIERIGGLDEKFGSGNFEDDDFCLRAAAAGYKARIALDAFIHHTGSQTFKGAGINYQQSLSRNWEIFKTKWKLPQDLPYGANYSFKLDTQNLSQYYIPFSAEAGISHTLPSEEAEATVANIAMFEKMVQDAQADGSWERAIQLLTEELNLNHPKKEVVSLCNALGYSYFMSGLPRQAEIAFKSGLAINPHDIDLLNNIASLYLQQEEYDKASDYVTCALRLDPHDVGALGTLGECAVKLAKFDAALQAYEQIKRLSPATDGIDQTIADLTRLADANADAALPGKNIHQPHTRQTEQ